MRGSIGVLLLVVSAAAAAHSASDSFLTLEVQGNTVALQWEVALRDLEFALGVDTDGDGLIRWGELRRRQVAIARYLNAHLRLKADGLACEPGPAQHLVSERADGGYAVMRMRMACPRAARVLQVSYRLLFDLDAQHRGLLHLRHGSLSRSLVFSPAHPTQTIELVATAHWQSFVSYLREGIHHIWSGLDHLLFLLTLLLPALLGNGCAGRQTAGAGTQVVVLRTRLLALATIVTAFTIAHSVTLASVVLGAVPAPGNWVEAAIAGSVIVAALNNLLPSQPMRPVLMAFGFGLVHGFGFAGALRDLGLPDNALLSSLLAFNLGVEAGQLAVVAAVLPVAFVLCRHGRFHRVVLKAGSLAIAVVGLAWLVEQICAKRGAGGPQLSPNNKPHRVHPRGRKVQCYVGTRPHDYEDIRAQCRDLFGCTDLFSVRTGVGWGAADPS